MAANWRLPTTNQASKASLPCRGEGRYRLRD